jgi:hypothetical protein
MDVLCKSLSRHSPCYTNPLFHPDPWKPFEQRVDQYTRGIQQTIPEGTILWHGTTREEPHFHPGRVSFFGLEPTISMWYTLEEAEKKQRAIGYVYQFRVDRPIALDRYIPTIAEHPGVETCLHPQVVLHGYDNYHALMGPFDLSVELTLNRDLDSLRLEQRYVVDIKHLSELTAFPISSLCLKKRDNTLFFEKVIN